MIVLDLETEPIRPGVQAPRPVTCQLAGDVPALPLDEYTLSRDGAIVITAASRAFAHAIRTALAAPELCGQHLVFDLIVLAEHGHATWTEVLALCDRGGVRDVELREKLLDIADGTYADVRRSKRGYNLGALAAKYGAGSLDKTSPWRTRYAELERVPVAQWPADALDYALGDAGAPMTICAAQERRRADLGRRVGADPLADEAHSFRKALGRALTSAWGICTDADVVERYRADALAAQRRAREKLLAGGFVYLGRDGKWHRRDKLMQAEVERLWRERGETAWPTTASGKFPEISRAVARGLDSDLVHAWIDWRQADAANSRIAEVEAGAGAHPIHTRFDLAESGRSTSDGPNIQNRKTKGRDRECFAPRPAPDGARTCYLDVDHDGLELCTVAQALLWIVGWSKLAEALCAGRSPHLEVAAVILGIAPDEARARHEAGDKDVDDARQSGKIANFGFPGGCGVDKFCDQALAKYGVVISKTHRAPGDRCGHCLKAAWRETWPEFKEYFRAINAHQRTGLPARHLVTGRLRGSCGYTDECNTLFQGLGADLTGDALYELWRACLGVVPSALAGSRVENYVHDQYLVACAADEHLNRRAEDLEAIVTGVARAWLPDLAPACTATPAACARWSKRARRVEDEHGSLVVWEYHPLVEAVWAVGGAAPARRADVAERHGAAGRDALAAVGETVLDKPQRRWLDARLMREVTGYERGPGAARAAELARGAAAWSGASLAA